ncbi:MAG: Na+/H+ antiporter subunit E, partial [Gammaproteobacteria bacterium]|nr:Na+/H+ antiporter subunit E [Gammaproteobacteria bacterium]
MLRIVSFIAVLYGFWLLLSGLFQPFLLSVGLACAIGVVLIARRMSVVDHEGFPVHLAWGVLLRYWPWLVKEIVKSGWQLT